MYNKAVFTLQIKHQYSNQEMIFYLRLLWRSCLLLLIILVFVSSYLAVRLEKAEEKITHLQMNCQRESFL